MIFCHWQHESFQNQAGENFDDQFGHPTIISPSLSVLSIVCWIGACGSSFLCFSIIIRITWTSLWLGLGLQGNHRVKHSSHSFLEFSTFRLSCCRSTITWFNFITTIITATKGVCFAHSAGGRIFSATWHGSKRKNWERLGHAKATCKV